MLNQLYIPITWFIRTIISTDIKEPVIFYVTVKGQKKVFNTTWEKALNYFDSSNETYYLSAYSPKRREAFLILG